VHRVVSDSSHVSKFIMSVALNLQKSRPNIVLKISDVQCFFESHPVKVFLELNRLFCHFYTLY